MAAGANAPAMPVSDVIGMAVWQSRWKAPLVVGQEAFRIEDRRIGENGAIMIDRPVLRVSSNGV